MTSRGDTYALQVVLERVLGVVRLLNARVEGVVDAIELTPHGVGKCAQRRVDLAAQLLADLALALRSRDVLLRELQPRVRNTDAVNGTRETCHTGANTDAVNRTRETCHTGANTAAAKCKRNLRNMACRSAQ